MKDCKTGQEKAAFAYNAGRWRDERKEKPFECVGTYSEVRYAVSLTIKKLGDDLPYLLKYYKDNYELELNHDLEHSYNEMNNIDIHFEELLKKELDKYV